MSLRHRKSHAIPCAGRVPALGEVRIMEQELRTALTGSFIDQAELHGFLQRLRALGLGRVDVHPYPNPTTSHRRRGWADHGEERPDGLRVHRPWTAGS